jgi:hypothetical protein
VSSERWGGILARINKRVACDLDDVVGRFDIHRNPVGRDIFPSGVAPPMPEARFKNGDFICIGIRVDKRRTNDLADLGMRLATLALEKDVEVIVLNHLDYSGLERFGFRCERIVDDSGEDTELCELQVRRFWNISLVL